MKRLAMLLLALPVQADHLAARVYEPAGADLRLAALELVDPAGAALVRPCLEAYRTLGEAFLDLPGYRACFSVAIQSGVLAIEWTRAQ